MKWNQFLPVHNSGFTHRQHRHVPAVENFEGRQILKKRKNWIFYSNMQWAGYKYGKSQKLTTISVNVWLYLRMGTSLRGQIWGDKFIMTVFRLEKGGKRMRVALLGLRLYYSTLILLVGIAEGSTGLSFKALLDRFSKAPQIFPKPLRSPSEIFL